MVAVVVAVLQALQGQVAANVGFDALPFGHCAR
ncbi:hypothetical protein HNQ59_003974 [Chitinivorax tropicus]|uniref:Uncharacterized protein n=1 Tax=Chitinivorax tropicus TaxID=714531 RepID=A0A840MU91_9PROT|nr:hypothetical protein [Chitinivorax tropicus]